MIRVRTVEIWVGVFVACGMAALFMLAMKVSNLTVVSDDVGYAVTAHFENISGLKVRSPVSMAGVTIGRVTDIGFDPATFQALVTMRIEKRFNEIPNDTSASIFTQGLLGEKYVGLEAGGSPEMLQEGDEIQITQSSLVLENLIGQFLFSKATDTETK